METIDIAAFRAARASRGRTAIPAALQYDWDAILELAKNSPIRRTRGDDFDVKVATHLRQVKDAIKRANLDDTLIVFVDTNDRDNSLVLGLRELLQDQDDEAGEDDANN